MRDRHFVYETFTPAETAAICGVTVETQRNWRRLGHLEDLESTGEGWNRFPAHDLAIYLVLSQLAAQSIPPAKAKEIAAHAAKRIMFFAFEHPLMVVDDEGRQVDEAPIKLPPGFVRRFVVAFDGAVQTHDDLQAFFEENSAKGWAAATVILDAKHLGKMLATRCGRPLVVLK